MAYVFGVDPLQQYLLPLSRGRLQALSIAWDARPASEGGQRWYHLYPDESSTTRTHCTGPAPTRTGTPAAPSATAPTCKRTTMPHSRSFDTQFAELNVGCEACHGPGEQHLELARQES